MNEYKIYQKGGMIISLGKDFNPYPPLTYEGSTLVNYSDFKVKFEGIALVVKDIYKPQYINIWSYGGNHVMRIPVTDDYSFEYCLWYGIRLL